MALYLPDSVDFNNNCVSVLNNYTARVYESDTPNSSGLYDYTDYALDNHYIAYYGSELLESSPSCYPTDLLTHSVLDRTDFVDIFVIGVGLFLITFLLFYKLLSYLFRGWF